MSVARPYHHGNLREALLKQAVLTVREDGVDALSLRELAREVGVSHAAPRRHFADRQALLNALAQAGFERLGRELGGASAARDEHDEFEARLQRCAHAYIGFATRDVALLELMFAGKHDEAVDRSAREAFDPVLRLILQGQDERALEDSDPERVGLMLLSTIHGIAALRNAGMVEAAQLQWLVDDAIARFLRGSQSFMTIGVNAS